VYPTSQYILKCEKTLPYCFSYQFQLCYLFFSFSAVPLTAAACFIVVVCSTLLFISLDLVPLYRRVIFSAFSFSHTLHCRFYRYTHVGALIYFSLLHSTLAIFINIFFLVGTGKLIHICLFVYRAPYAVQWAGNPLTLGPGQPFGSQVS
jgi:hypothetical protein